MFDVIKACESYTKENLDASGQRAHAVLDEDCTAFLEYSSDVWEDGAPVAKMFERNDLLRVKLPCGVTLNGVIYYGRVSEHMIFEFVYNYVWYRTYVDHENMVFGSKLIFDPSANTSTREV